MSFERLKVYQAAVLLDQLVTALIPATPKGAKEIDNLRRTMGSGRHNIAEAFGNEQPGRKRNHLNIARGAFDEGRSSMLKLVDDGAFKKNDIKRPVVLTVTVSKMLTNWINSLPDEN